MDFADGRGPVISDTLKARMADVVAATGKRGRFAIIEDRRIDVAHSSCPRSTRIGRNSG
jgi:hypothetical protein